METLGEYNALIVFVEWLVRLFCSHFGGLVCMCAQAEWTLNNGDTFIFKKDLTLSHSRQIFYHIPSPFLRPTADVRLQAFHCLLANLESLTHR